VEFIFYFMISILSKNFIWLVERQAL